MKIMRSKSGRGVVPCVRRIVIALQTVVSPTPIQTVDSVQMPTGVTAECRIRPVVQLYLRAVKDTCVQEALTQESVPVGRFATDHKTVNPLAVYL